ncbi:hypothetical protein ACLOJK_001022 [Asimina triloba]
MSLQRDYNARFCKNDIQSEREEKEKSPGHTKGDLNISISSCRPSVFTTRLGMLIDVGSEAVLELIYECIARGRMCDGIAYGRS